MSVLFLIEDCNLLLILVTLNIKHNNVKIDANIKLSKPQKPKNS